MKAGSSVVCVMGDAGGAEAVAPVAAELRRRDRAIATFAYLQARSVCTRIGLAFQELSEQADEAEMGRIVNAARPNLVLAATSCNRFNFERRFSAIARGLGVPTLAVLDSAARCEDRFRSATGKAEWPDWLAVADDTARRVALEAGCPATRIRVTGHPALDGLHAMIWTAEQRQCLRASLAVPNDGKLVVFASQPDPSWLHEAGLPPGSATYDRDGSLALLVNALEEIADRNQIAVTLLVRPHPRERELPKPPAVRHIRLQMSATHDRHELARSADVVVGMNSFYLLEAAHLNVPAISLQDPENTFNPAGVSFLRDPAELSQELLFLFQGEPRGAARSNRAPHGNATANVIEWIESICSTHSRLQETTCPR